VDIRADLYSLGCTFYFLLTGKPPFGDYPIIKKLMMHQSVEPRPIEELRPEVPLGLRGILRKLLAKLPENRFQTPAELGQALTAATKAEPAPPAQSAEVTKSSEVTTRIVAKADTEVGAPKKRTDLPYLPSRPPPKKGFELPAGVSEAQKIAVLDGHRGWVTSLGFSPDRRMLVSGGVDGGLRIWDVSGNELRNRAIPRAHRRDVTAVSIAGNNHLIASACGHPEDGIRLWDYSGEQPNEVAVVNIAGVTVDTLAFAPDLRLLASGGGDKLVRVWNLTGTQMVSRTVLRGHSGGIKALAFAADSQTVYSGSLDGTIRIWNLTRFWSKEQAVLEGSWGQVCTLALSPDNKVLAFGGLDQAVRLWDMDGPEPREWAVLIGHPGVIRLVQFHPDGKTLISVCDGGRMILWDVLTGSKQREWLLPRSRLYSVALTHDGRYLATGFSDSIVLFRLYPRREQQS
jgi:WD40 repeat protein